MKYDSIIKEVMDRARLSSREQAREATHATMEILGERLFGGEAEDLAAQLPEELARSLTSSGPKENFGLQEFLRRLGEREGIEAEQAEEHAKAVFTVLQEMVSTGELTDIRSQLPDEYERLFGLGPGRTRQ